MTSEQAIGEVKWKKLEKRHRIVIAGNTASVFVRRWLFPDKLLFTVFAYIGTKAIDLKMQPQNGARSSVIELDADQTLTEVNVASELETLCMIFLGQWSAAQIQIEAE